MTELELLLDACRRRRVLGEALLAELEALCSPPLPEPPQRVVTAPGWRDVGLARFRNTRLASAK